MSEILSIFYIILIFILGFSLASKTSKKIGNNIVFLVFVVHMLFSFLFYLFAKNNSADANMYYAQALLHNNLLEAFGTSTQFIIFITTFFVQIGFSKLVTFFIFGLFGFIGFQYLIKMLDYNKMRFMGMPVVFLVLLLPGFHFWTSSLGKDSLFFMLLMISFYGLQNIKKRFYLFLLAFPILVIIRPHMGFILMFSITLALFLRNPIRYKAQHLIAGIVAIGLLFAFLPFISSFLNIEQLEIDAINKRLEFYSDYGANKTDNISSYVDVSSYSLPLKMFTYLFRPLFFDARSILQLLASFENLFLILIIIKWLKSIRFRVFKWYRVLREPDKILAMYVLFGWIALAASMYNLGLASRQKYMLLPVIFILIFRDYRYKNLKRML